MSERYDHSTLAQAFAEALARDFAAHGAAAIAELRQTKVDVYLRLVAGVDQAAAPVRPSVIAGMSDEEVLEIVRQLDRWDKENPRQNVDEDVIEVTR